jgi:hypothetical protein
MWDSNLLMENLRADWINSHGDIRQFTSAVLARIKAPAADTHLVIQLALAVAQLPAIKPKGGALTVEAIVSGRDRDPYVCLRFAGEMIQMPVDDARQHAH